MKNKFILIWFNKCFGLNRDQALEFNDLKTLFHFIKSTESVYKSCHYGQLKFKIKTTRINA